MYTVPTMFTSDFLRFSGNNCFAFSTCKTIKLVLFRPVLIALQDPHFLSAIHKYVAEQRHESGLTSGGQGSRFENWGS